jgi:Rod binding domain-containing protein
MAAEESQDQRGAFQSAVAGLLFGQMIKSLRSGVGKPAYLHGGQAEDLFQAQMDQVVAEQLARHHGGPFVDELYRRFLIDHPDRASSELATLSHAAKSVSAVQSAQAASWARPTTTVSGNTTGTPVIPALYRK